MEASEEDYRGHACIVVGDARDWMKRTKTEVRVERLVALLREEGVPEKELRSVAVVIHGPDSALSDLGLYRHGVVGALSATSTEPQREFSLIIHAQVGILLPLILLHEAGHVRSCMRGRRGFVLYHETAVRWLSRVSKVLLPTVFVLWITLLWLGLAPVWTWLVVVVVAGLCVYGIMAPRLILWLLSSAEWKANWFMWRNRKLRLVGGEPDGTEMLYLLKYRIDHL